MMRLDGDTDAHGSAEEIPFAHTDLRSVGRPHAHLGGRTPDVARPNRHVDSTATSAFTPLDAHVAEERELAQAAQCFGHTHAVQRLTGDDESDVPDDRRPRARM